MIEIRPYASADYEALKINLEESDLFNPAIDTREILESKIEANPASILVAVVNDEVAGNVYIIEDQWSSFIFRLAVRKGFRRRGIGQTLMEEAEKRLRQKGIKEVALFVRDTHQELQDYYIKLGYTPMNVSHKCMYKNL
ncbi:MAG: GNAT family N-acetyltransferase [Nanoarchaeota archaeon]